MARSISTERRDFTWARKREGEGNVVDLDLSPERLAIVGQVLDEVLDEIEQRRKGE